MLRKWFVFAVTLFLWSSSLINFTQGEDILFFNLYKEEESSENIPTQNYDQDDESLFFKKNMLNNTDSELIGHTSQSNDLEDENPSDNISRVTEVSDKKAASHSKHTTTKNSQFNIYSKATVEDGTSVSKESAPVSDTAMEGGLYSFVRLCFDIIESFIQGVMRGIMSVGDPVANSKPADVSTYYSQSSTSRIWKREISPIGVLHGSTESSAVKPNETNINEVHMESSTVLDLKTNLHTTLGQSKDDTKTTISGSSMQSLTNLENSKNIEVERSSIKMVNENDSLVSTSPSVLNDESELKKNYVVKEEKANKDVLPHTSFLYLLQEESVWKKPNKEDYDLGTPLDVSTEEENSNSFLLKDFINKQNDPKLKEIIQKQFDNAQLYPQPHEGEYHADEETSTATILMATGGVLGVLVLVAAVVGLVAAYKFGLIKSDFGIGRNRFGNRNPPSQRTTMA